MRPQPPSRLGLLLWPGLLTGGTGFRSRTVRSVRYDDGLVTWAQRLQAAEADLVERERP